MVNGTIDNKLTKSKDEEPPFTYSYGFSFYCAVSSFLLQEINGICNIYWYIDYYRKYRFDKAKTSNHLHNTKHLRHPKMPNNENYNFETTALTDNKKHLKEDNKNQKDFKKKSCCCLRKSKTQTLSTVKKPKLPSNEIISFNALDKEKPNGITIIKDEVLEEKVSSKKIFQEKSQDQIKMNFPYPMLKQKVYDEDNKSKLQKIAEEPKKFNELKYDQINLKENSKTNLKLSESNNLLPHNEELVKSTKSKSSFQTSQVPSSAKNSHTTKKSDFVNATKSKSSDKVLLPPVPDRKASSSYSAHSSPISSYKAISSSLSDLSLID